MDIKNQCTADVSADTIDDINHDRKRSAAHLNDDPLHEHKRKRPDQVEDNGSSGIGSTKDRFPNGNASCTQVLESLSQPLQQVSNESGDFRGSKERQPFSSQNSSACKLSEPRKKRAKIEDYFRSPSSPKEFHREVTTSSGLHLSKENCTPMETPTGMKTNSSNFGIDAGDVNRDLTLKRKIPKKQPKNSQKASSSTSVQPAKKPKITETENELHRGSQSLVESSLSENDTSTNLGLNSSAPQYLSNESVSDHEELQEVVIKKRGVGRDWIMVETFENAKMAQDQMESLKDFERDNHQRASSGKKLYFRCKHLQCPAMYQLFDNNTTTIILKSNEHNHAINETVASETGAKNLKRIPDASKLKIREYREMKLKPKAIVSTMRNKHPEMALPTLKQVYGLNARERKDQPNKISLGELEKWLTDRLAIPDDEHTVFVVNFEVNYDIPYFRFFLSTRNLLRQTLKSTIVHADTTYKLNYEGFPLLVVGVTDLDRHFHPSGVALCTEEKTEDFQFIFQSLLSGIHRDSGQPFLPTTLVADAAEAIHNGFTNVFGLLLIIMCWAHVKRAIKKRYKGNRNIDAILSDLDLLQTAPSIDSFQKALQLFLEKWKKEEEFILYFKEQWVDHNKNWFEGVQHRTPKTDNALEGKNKWIKDSHFMRERPPLREFLDSLVKMINDWSCEYIQDKVFVMEPSVDLPLWTRSYQWVKLAKRVVVVRSGENGGSYAFKIPAKAFETVVEVNLNACKSLDEFKNQVFSYYIVEMPSKDWKKGTCTCPSFYKMFICKHLVGMAMRYKLVEPPVAAKAVPLGQKRKRRRPPKAKHALIVQ